ncbi:hypothetical protein ACX0G9_18800 [Flavitalea flava]
MKKHNLSYDTRKTKIYKDIYRPSSSLSRFLGTLLSVIVVGHSPVNSPDQPFIRKSK